MCVLHAHKELTWDLGLQQMWMPAMFVPQNCVQYYVRKTLTIDTG